MLTWLDLATTLLCIAACLHVVAWLPRRSRNCPGPITNCATTDGSKPIHHLKLEQVHGSRQGGPGAQKQVPISRKVNGEIKDTKVASLSQSKVSSKHE